LDPPGVPVPRRVEVRTPSNGQDRRQYGSWATASQFTCG